MKFDLAGKKAVVTGGSSGIGKAIVETLMKQGATVFVIDLNENPAHTKAGIKTLTVDTVSYTHLTLPTICSV